MKKRPYYLVLLLSLFACRDDSFKRNADVYIAGVRQEFSVSKTTSKARYWKNGEPTEIEEANKWIIISSMAVSGKDIYVAGFERSYGGHYTAKYWKNGIGVSLTDGEVPTKATCIAVSGNDVYVAGYSTSEGAKYWKNGVLTPVENASSIYSRINAITISGKDIYLAGRSDSSGAFWKNGIVTELKERAAYINAITVYDGDVYLAGVLAGVSPTSGYSGPDIATYWKNDSAVHLGLGSLTSIALNGSDVYVAGYSNSGPFTIARYWKNGVATDLAVNARANGIAVYNADIYVVGEFNNAQPMYWKNGESSPLGVLDSITTDSFASIIVK